ncbi:rod shape-determining protein [Streptomyces sp. TRM 70351]|uniref:rod shape-determining protein n=1 Tax=Streptomyces sp. TRM 70351 TaxID=3116552 RepID=UPI002E7BC8ED|nr:rod shape-determining protein [Streptomyces sp. TRM 70351]MEE1930346.1 rod shape-determining protein [Streptomyces sp. TRM 70351]
MNFSYEQLRRCTVAVDLGADRTRVYVREAGLVVDEPSVAAVNTRSGALIAVGAPAARMTGRTPDHITVLRPVSDGTVSDVQMAQRMLRAMVGDRVRGTWRRRPMLRAAMCVPHDAEPLAQRAAVQTLAGLGARRVELVDTLVAAAVGCGLPVERPEATMIVVCGAECTQVAVLSLGAIVAAEKVPVGGESVSRAVAQHLRGRYEVALPSAAVRRLMAEAAEGAPDGGTLVVHGRDAASGLARTAAVDPGEVRAAVEGPYGTLLDAIRRVLHRCAPDLVADLADRGVVLAGGSAGLPGLEDGLRRATSMAVHLADDPAGGAVSGLAAMMEGRVRPLRLDPLVR